MVLRRLEYRGYDSAGVAIVDGDRMSRRANAPGASPISRKLDGGEAADRHITGSATPAGPRTAKSTDENAHPHFDQSGKLALVHNGVIENYQALKDAADPRRRPHISLPKPTPKSSRI